MIVCIHISKLVDYRSKENMDKNLKQIVNAAEAVKKKFKKLRNCESENEKSLESIFKPVLNPLNQITNELKHKNISNEVNNVYEEMKIDEPNGWSTLDETIKKNRRSDSFMTPSNSINTSVESDNAISENEYEDEDDGKDESSMSSIHPDGSSWSLSSENIKDIPFGIRHVRGKLMLGSAAVTISDRKILVGEHNYDKTPGLMELLTKRIPNSSVITKDDIMSYKSMLLETNVHRRDYDRNKPIKSNKGKKYLEFIKPLFANDKKTQDSYVQGSGLPILKKWKRNVDYVYWDDPNELVERLKLLIASRDAGNTGLDNEILSIIEELNENGLLN